MRSKVVVFRLDDICETMDIHNFKIMRHILKKHGIRPLLGIVPDNQDETLIVQDKIPEYNALINDCLEDGWLIAMHGVHHVYDSYKKGLITKRPLSEFVGKTLNEQIDLLKEGQRKLASHNWDTRIFFAPGHSYDKNTIRALSATGFKVVSDGRSHGKYQWMNIEFIPLRYFSCVTKPSGKITTLCFHLNNMKEVDFQMVENYIERYRKYIIDFSDVLKLSSDCKVISLIDEKLFVFYEYHIHPFLSYIKRRLCSNGFTLGKIF